MLFLFGVTTEPADPPKAGAPRSPMGAFGAPSPRRTTRVSRPRLRRRCCTNGSSFLLGSQGPVAPCAQRTVPVASIGHPSERVPQVRRHVALPVGMLLIADQRVAIELSEQPANICRWLPLQDHPAGHLYIF